jgi:hypothetical protein
MPRLVILIALLFLAWLAYRWFMRTPPEQVRRGLRQAVLWAFAVVLILLAMTGRLHWIVAIGAAALPFARRAFSLLRFLPMAKNLYGRYQAKQSYQAPKSGQTSTVETRFLRMTLDHDSGDMDGEVLEGGYEDRLLSQLSLNELLGLHAECRSDDPESAALLEAYLDHCHTQWREHSSAHANSRTDNGKPTSTTMTTEEAREILGIDKNASEREITQAHRRLMHKLHPDRGGSNYLASKINLAKDCLLGK